MNEIKLGDKVRSVTTPDFQGLVTGICEYLHCETRYEVTPEITISGEVKNVWFSEKALIKI